MGKDSHRDDRFSRMMFGNRSERLQDHKGVSNTNPSSIDIETIIENVSKLKDSTQNLKPLFQMVYPFVQEFLKKK